MVIYCSSCGSKQMYTGTKPKNCSKCTSLFERPIEIKKMKSVIQEEIEDDVSLGFDLNPSSIKISVDKKVRFEEINGSNNKLERPFNSKKSEDLDNLINRMNNK